MLNRLKKWLMKEGLSDCYPNLTNEIIELLGKEMAPLFDEIRQAFFEAVVSLPYKHSHDYPFGLYHYSLESARNALVERTNKRFSVYYKGKHKENTFFSWAGINRNLLMIAIEELFGVSDHLLTFLIHGKQKDVLYNFFCGENLKSFGDTQSGFVFETTKEGIWGLNTVIFTQVVNGELRKRLIEQIGQDSFLTLLTQLDNRKKKNVRKEMGYGDILFSVVDLMSTNQLVVYHKNAILEPNIFILGDITLLTLSAIHWMANVLGIIPPEIVAYFLTKNVLVKFNDNLWVDLKFKGNTHRAIQLKTSMFWHTVPDHTVPSGYVMSECSDLPEFEEEKVSPEDSLNTVEQPETVVEANGHDIPPEENIPENCFETDDNPDVKDDLSALRSLFRNLIKSEKLPVFKGNSDAFKLVILEDSTALTLSGLKTLNKELRIPKKEILDRLDRYGILKNHQSGGKFLLVGLKDRGMICFLLKNEFWNGDIPQGEIPENYDLLEKPSKEKWGVNE